MNINQYKESMNEIDVKIFTIEDLINKHNKTRREKIRKKVVILMLGGILFVNFLFFSIHRPDITITALAAEQEFLLNNNFIDFNLSATAVDGDASDNNISFVNSDINFICEGRGINYITYSCSDENIELKNRKNAAAYYVENIEIPVSEYHERFNETNILYGSYGYGQTMARITKFVGNSYRVNYETQNDKRYGLVMAATVDDMGNFKINDTIIKIDIHYNNGTIQHKKLMIESSENAFMAIKIRIL